jgi:uncharacterized alkaline shock family protein YloU
MNRLLGVLLTIATFVISGFLVLEQILDYADYTLEIDWLTTNVRFEIYIALFVLSILTIMTYEYHKRVPKMVYFESKNDQGTAHIAKGVFDDVASRVVKSKEQVASFTIETVQAAEGIDIEVSITPDLEKDGSLVALAGDVAKEMKEMVAAMTGVSVQNVHVTFTGSKEDEK